MTDERLIDLYQTTPIYQSIIFRRKIGWKREREREREIGQSMSVIVSHLVALDAIDYGMTSAA